MTERMQQILKRYKVKVRKNPQTVEHQTYRFRTVVDPESFAIYEAALKANYISNMVFLKARGQWGQFMACQGYHAELFGKNDIPLPWIAECWGGEKGEQAADDYRHCAVELTERTGKDSESGRERNLYYGLLD
jgi:hypothetical protein